MVDCGASVGSGTQFRNEAQEGIRSMAYHAFYCCNSTGKVVEAANAQPIDLDSAGAMVAEMLLSDDDFFGLIDDAETTLQFLRIGQLVRMEIPSPELGGSLAKDVSLAEAQATIRSLPEAITAELIPGLILEAW